MCSEYPSPASTHAYDQLMKLSIGLLSDFCGRLTAGCHQLIDGFELWLKLMVAIYVAPWIR